MNSGKVRHACRMPVVVLLLSPALLHLSNPAEAQVLTDDDAILPRTASSKETPSTDPRIDVDSMKRILADEPSAADLLGGDLERFNASAAEHGIDSTAEKLRTRSVVHDARRQLGAGNEPSVESLLSDEPLRGSRRSPRRVFALTLISAAVLVVALLGFGLWTMDKGKRRSRSAGRRVRRRATPDNDSPY